jgi:hypothetical protein
MGSPPENQDVAGLHKTPTGIEGFNIQLLISDPPYQL